MSGLGGGSGVVCTLDICRITLRPGGDGQFMRKFLARSNRVAIFLIAGIVLSACGLPRSGPTEGEIRASSVENGGDVNIVNVTNDIAAATARSQALGFSREFLSAGSVSVDRINRGDVLAITVWENVDNGIFAVNGSKVTPLEGIQVDQLGNIFVPYAGTIRASGRTPEELRVKLTEILSSQTPDPQIEVRREAGNGATVSILGGVGVQGIFPIEASTKRLTGMLAAAGGISLDPNVVKITIRRGHQSGSIWMQDLFDNPANDIPLRAGDQIILEQDERYFVALGTTSQRRVRFETKNPSVIEALASLGGLRSYTSNPKGIFIFRVEPPEIANRVLGRTDITTPQKFAYVVDLTQESGIFIAQNFLIRDEDTLYTTEAPYVAWRNILNVVIGSLNTFSALDNAVTTAAGVFE